MGGPSRCCHRRYDACIPITTSGANSLRVNTESFKRRVEEEGLGGKEEGGVQEEAG